MTDQATSTQQLLEDSKSLTYSSGYLARVKELIAAGADVNAKDDDGRTPLHWAANRIIDQGQSTDASKFLIQNDAIKLLIQNGADVNAIDNNGNTPLYDAIVAAVPYEWHLDTSVRPLVDAGADVNVKNEQGRTPLHWATELLEERGQPSGLKGTIDLLIQKGADINAIDENGDTPLYNAVRKAVWFNLSSDSRVRPLVDAGADVNAKTKDGNTPLHWAAEQEWSDQIARLLIKHGADVNSKNAQGDTPLHKAAAFGNERTTWLMAHEAGAFVDATNEQGRTPLHEAAIKDAYLAGWTLIQSDADISIRDRDGRTPEKLAKSGSELGRRLKEARTEMVNVPFAVATRDCRLNNPVD